MGITDISNRLKATDLPLYVGNFLFFIFILVVMADPTNSILHKKDITFVLVVAYNMAVFKPDWSKLPYILLLVFAITVPWLTTTITTEAMNPEEALAAFKSISPVILLLWVRNYNLINLARGPVVICCIVMTSLYIAMLVEPLVENVLWTFINDSDSTIMMTRRSFFGIEMFAFYLKSCVSFLFVVAYYMVGLMDKTRRGVLNWVAMVFIMFTFMVSGTRSTMLAPFFLFIVIAFRVYRHSKRLKYIMLPVAFLVAIAFAVVFVAAIMETDEASNVVKYGHLSSYATLFDEHPLYLIFGQGPGTSFYSEGFNEVVFKTEWSYLEIIRCYGLFSLLIVYVYWRPLLTFWCFRDSDTFTYCMFWTYLAYLLIAGTNPLLISSTGMIILMMAYSYEDKVKRDNAPKPA